MYFNNDKTEVSVIEDNPHTSGCLLYSLTPCQVDYAFRLILEKSIFVSWIWLIEKAFRGIKIELAVVIFIFCFVEQSELTDARISFNSFHQMKLGQSPSSKRKTSNSAWKSVTRQYPNRETRDCSVWMEVNGADAFNMQNKQFWVEIT